MTDFSFFDIANFRHKIKSVVFLKESEQKNIRGGSALAAIFFSKF